LATFALPAPAVVTFSPAGTNRFITMILLPNRNLGRIECFDLGNGKLELPTNDS
jgi:hypothetical protein